jgi:hypothetical protein
VAPRAGVDTLQNLRTLPLLRTESCPFIPYSIAVPKQLSQLHSEREIGIQNSKLELEDKFFLWIPFYLQAVQIL